MKTKIIYLTLAFGIVYSAKAQQTTDFIDTVQVTIGDSIQMQVVYKNKEVMRNASDFDYNSIMRKVDQKIESVSEERKVTRITFNIPNSAQDKEIDSVTISGNGNIQTVVKETTDGKDITVTVSPKPTKPRKRTYDDVYLDLGLNTYLKNGSTLVSGSEPYDLRPWGSRYVALGYYYTTRIGKEKSPFYIQYGIEASWNNFMLQDDNRIIKGTNGLEFEPVLDRNFTRNKLVVNYLSIPVIPMIDFSSTHKNGFKFGVGGFAGYRINSWTKQTHFESGNRKRNKERDNYYLNDFRYGIMAVIGIEDAVDIFIKYDLNGLFESNKGPNLNVLSFGVHL